MANTTDMELAALNCDMSLACEIKHDDKLTEDDGVSSRRRSSLLSVRWRRLRILNLSLKSC